MTSESERSTASDTGICVRVYVNEGDLWHGQSLAEALVRRLQDLGCAGATIFRAWAGFGSHGELRATRMVDVMPPLPLIVEWIDTPDHVTSRLPLILSMVGEGLIVQFPVTIVQFTHQSMRQLPASRHVRDVMTRPVETVTTATPLHDLVAGLIDRAHRAVVVTDAQGRLIGIVTNSDLVERGGLSARVHLLSAAGTDILRHELDTLGTSPLVAADVMTQRVISATPEMTVRTAARLMDQRRLKRLPVVDQEGRPVGMVSRVDLLRTVAAPSGRTVVHQLSESVAPAPAADRGSASVQSLGRVGDIGLATVPIVGPNAPLSEVLDAVISTRLSRAVVVDADTHPLGIISDAELLRRVDPAARPRVLTTLMRRLPFFHAAPEDEEARHIAEATRASDLMTEVLMITAEMPIVEAIDRMLQSRCKILPVVDLVGRLIGMVDRADLLRALATAPGDGAMPASGTDDIPPHQPEDTT